MFPFFKKNIITERKNAEHDRQENISLMENLGKIDASIRRASGLDNMMSSVLEEVLSIFDCDRVWFFYPCDPDASTFRVPMEVTKPGYPGAYALRTDIPMMPDIAQNLREALVSKAPLTYVVGTDMPVNQTVADRFGVKSQMFMALYPKVDGPWVFGLHQCSYPRVWTVREQKLFQEIGERITDSLTSLLIYEDLQKKNRMLRMLSNVNRELIRATDERSLIDEILRVMVDMGGYHMLWIGFAEQDEAKTVRPVAQVGFETEYLASAKISWADNERGRGPTGTAIRTNKTQIARDIFKDPNMSPWRAAAIKSGYKSSIALPLSNEGKPFGALNIYATETDAFNKDEVAILEEVSKDLAFGISSLRTNAERVALEEELSKAVADRYKALFLSSRDAVMTLEPPTWKFTSGNPATLEMFGVKNEGDFLRYEPWTLSPERQPDGRNSMEKAKAMIDIALHEGSHLFEWTHRRINGEDFPTEVLLSKVEENGKSYLHALVRDITQRKRLEEKVKEYAEEKFKVIFDNVLDGILLADIETKKFITGNRKMCEMIGYSEEDLKKLGVMDIHPKDDLPYVLDQFEKQAKKEIQLSKNLPVKRKDGSIFYADVNSSPITIEGKNCLLGIFRDVTDRMNAEKKEREYVEGVENMNRLMVGRELKMIELKEEIEKLKWGMAQ